MQIQIFKAEHFLTTYDMQIPEGWNILTFFESFVQEFEFPGVDIDDVRLKIFVNNQEEEAQDGYLIMPTDQIRVVIQVWVQTIV